MINTSMLEKAIIGCILLDDKEIDQVMRVINEEEFDNIDAKRAFKAMHNLWCQELPIDTVLVISELSKTMRPEYICEVAEEFILECASTVPNPRNLGAYINMFQDIKSIGIKILITESLHSNKKGQSHDNPSPSNTTP